jgi:hypothetical protein
MALLLIVKTNLVGAMVGFFLLFFGGFIQEMLSED